MVRKDQERPEEGVNANELLSRGFAYRPSSVSEMSSIQTMPRLVEAC